LEVYCSSPILSATFMYKKYEQLTLGTNKALQGVVLNQDTVVVTQRKLM